MKQPDLDDRLRDAWVEREVPVHLRSRVMARGKALAAEGAGARRPARRLVAVTAAAAVLVVLAVAITMRVAPPVHKSDVSIRLKLPQGTVLVQEPEIKIVKETRP